MKSLINLSTALLADAGSICSVDTTRDIITIISRARHEGTSFFTITLPAFSVDFERSLEIGKIDSTLFSSWKKRACLPVFLRGFTSLVFGQDGVLLDRPDCSAVYCIRQVCRCFKKVKLPCTDKRTAAAFEKYVATEAVLPTTFDCDQPRFSHFRKCADAIWPDVFGVELNTFDLIPRHGPGATAEKISGNAKFSSRGWHERLQKHFPVDSYMFTSVNHMLNSKNGLNKVHMRSPGQELPVRVISVPKDLKTPRIIAIEPVCMQYTQQAIGRWIMNKIQRSSLIRGAIRFSDQTVNQDLAIRSSFDKSYATIDLSDASDRVPLSHVQQMLAACPDVLGAVEACRSTSAQIPSGVVIPLRKFASMGSALCFPIESMYFYTVVVHAILWSKGTAVTREEIHRISKRIHIYGDDIIVPKDETASVLEALALFSCKVNTTKSFWNGSFRESCGADAFCGIDVTPVYVREMCPPDRHSSSGVVSWISTSNQFYKRGMWKTADYMKHVIERLMGELPIVAETSPGLGWFSFQGLPSNLRQSKSLHCSIVYTFKVQAIKEKDVLDDYPAMLKYFLRTAGREERPLDRMFPNPIGKKHLTQSARCGAVSRKRHWVPAA